VKFLFEGEEELGSPNLPHFIEANKPFLAAEAVVCFDGGLHASGRPQIELGLKGLLSVELSCRTADLDLHSMWAPVIENAAWRLIKAMSTLRSSDGRIAVEGWYSSVCPPPLEALSALDSILFDEEQLQKEFGITSFVGGVKGREALRLLIFEPTANISGISAGYIGLGFKTVLPSSATARIDFRLVPEQDPKTLFVLLKSHLARNGFSDIKVTPLSSVEPSRTPISAPIFKVVASAASKVYMADPVVYPNSPGSGPDFLFTKRLGLKSVWTGCSPPFSNAHAPNEFTTVDAYRSGILYAVDIIEEFGKSLPSD
jgi:acetylornithine deacetylase/succinyl-diaminopimelate desuccinylase-like protein